MTNLSKLTKATPLVLVGCGNMGAAMVGGWLAAGLSPEALIIIDPQFDVRSMPSAEGAVVVPSADALDAGVTARILVLAVKPQIINDVMPSLKPFMDADTVAVSIAAGVTLEQMARELGSDDSSLNPQLVRAMPNTPAAVGAGATGIVASAGVKEDGLALAVALMQASGAVVVLENEDQINGVTATSGSGPAYVFHMVEALAAAGVRVGLSEADAVLLARQTIIGAAKLLEAEPDVGAATLRERVTSPNGTTEAALGVLMGEDGLTELMKRTTRAAVQRSKELAG